MKKMKCCESSPRTVLFVEVVKPWRWWLSFYGLPKERYGQENGREGGG